jgi:hypothetical protein
MKKIIICLFCACFLHFSAFAMCYNVSLGEAISDSPVIVYAEVSFEATTNAVYQTVVQINVIESIKGDLNGNSPANWYFPGSNGQRVVKKESIKGIFFLSKNAKNEWIVNGIGCYNHRLIVDDNNKIILNVNADRYNPDLTVDKRVTITDFKEGVALYLKSMKKSGKFKKNKKTKNETYQKLVASMKN